MKKTTVDFAWAMPVDIVTFGSHLEPYDKLQPTFNALRLCNRFGRGANATITKLPVELVQHVEAYLLEHECAILCPIRAESYRCWEDRCEPIDHLCDEEILDLYNERMGELHVPTDCECGCGEDTVEYRPVLKVTADVRDYMAEVVSDAWGDLDTCEETHHLRVDDWFRQVGSPAGTDRGSIDKFSDVLRKHFGLKVWISHVQKDKRGEYSLSNITHSTKAYLHLPQTSSIQHECRDRLDDWLDEFSRVPTESGLATALAIPPVPSDRSLSRFERCIQILGLAESQKALSEKLALTKEDQQNDDTGGHETYAPVRKAIAIKPDLLVLMRSTDDTYDRRY